MPIPRTFIGFLDTISKTGSVALVDARTGREITYSELATHAKDLAFRLDFKKGDRIILYNLNQLDWIIAFFAIQLRGGIVVPIDERVSETFIAKVTSEIKPVLVISDTKNEILFAGIKKNNFHSCAQQTLIHKSSIETDPNDPCEIIFTSGTWSDPKGVTLSQRNILSNVEQILSVYPDKKPSVVLGILPLSHAYQQTLGLFTPLSLGSKIIFLKVTNSLDLVGSIKKYNIVVIPLVPRVLDLLFSAITRKVRNKRVRAIFTKVVSISRFLPRGLRRLLFYFVHKELGQTLTTLVSGGSPLTEKIDHFFQGLGYKVMVGYGLSECSPIVSAHFGQFRKSGEVGKPLPNVEVSLGDGGEIIVSGENVFLGYWQNYSVRSSFLTGDLAFRLKNGSLVLKGRNKNLIIFDSGEKCFCEDLELIVNEIEGVDMSCFVGKNRNGTIVTECLIGTKHPNSFNEREVIQSIKKKIPLGINVSRCVFIKDNEFPLTHTLKPNRAEVSRLLD